VARSCTLRAWTLRASGILKVLASTFIGKSTNASPAIINRKFMVPRRGRPGCEVCCAFLELRASAIGYPDIRIIPLVSRQSRQKNVCIRVVLTKPTEHAQIIATDECSTKRVSTSCSPNQEIPQSYQEQPAQLRPEAKLLEDFRYPKVCGSPGKPGEAIGRERLAKPPWDNHNGSWGLNTNG